MENNRDWRRIRGEIEKWGKASQLLADASDRLSDCCGVQVTLSISFAIVHLIIFLYQCTGYWVNQKYISPHEFWGRVHFLICYALMMIFVLAAAQRAHNEAKNLYRKLCVLRNLLHRSVEAAACARAALGLARRLRVTPLRVRLLSSRAVQMALLADILTFVANYTIVLLQYNNVL